MRRRRDRRRGVLLLAGALLVGEGGMAQTVTQPPPPSVRPATSGPRARPLLPAAEDVSPRTLPPAPEPIPGPAGMGLSVGRDVPAATTLPINLATAMQLSGVNPLDIAAATAQVRQALALQLQARVLWIPNLNGGPDYARHDGVQQNIFTGVDFQKGRQSFFVGGGPALSVGVADAIFAPLAARRVVAARRADLQSARNDVLFQVAQAYFDVQAARGRILGVEATIVRAEILANFARGLAPSLIPPLEINRALAELQSLRQARQVAIRDWRVTSARLAEVLLLEPSTLLAPIEPPYLQLTLVPSDRSAEDLLPVALNSRPEIASRRELVAAATQIFRREKSRPFLPNLYVISPATTTGALAAGQFLAGPNGQLNTNGTRFDMELAAVWQLQNAGLGNVGRIRQSRAEQDLAAIELTRTVFRVKSEVTQAVARLQTARVRVVEAEEGVRQAVESADKNFIGLRETTRPAGELLRLIVRPQEVVAAIIALNSAYEQYADAIGAYNAAQFEVYRALGQPAQWVTSGAALGGSGSPPAPPCTASAPAPGDRPR